MFRGSEKADSHQELNPGHLACAASTLPLSYDNRTTTSPHNPLYVLGLIPVTAGLSLYFASKCLKTSLFKHEANNEISWIARNAHFYTYLVNQNPWSCDDWKGIYSPEDQCFLAYLPPPSRPQHIIQEFLWE